jgi:adenosine kinase
MKKEEGLDISGDLKVGDFLVVAPNNPVGAVRHVKAARAVGVDYMFDPAFNIVHFPVDDLSEAVKNCRILVGNDYEIELIRRQLRWSDEEFFSMDRVVITTLGSKGSVVREGLQEISIPVAKVDKVIDPTGAGDAYRAGFVAGFVRGFDLEVCGRMGAVASAYAVETYGTQNYEYSTGDFATRYRENFGIELPL